MTTAFSNKIIHTNLQLLYNATNYCLHKNNFVIENQAGPGKVDELINHLLKLNLIEPESDPDIYFLTTEGFEAVEDSYYVAFEEPDELPEKRELSYQLVQSEEEIKQTNKRKRKEELAANRWFKQYLFLIIVSVFAFGINYYRNQKRNNINLDSTQLQEIIDEFKNKSNIKNNEPATTGEFIMLDEDGDTIAVTLSTLPLN